MIQILRNIIFPILVFAIGTANIFAQSYSWSPLLNSSNSNGVSGPIYSIASYQNDIVVAGGFTRAGGINAKNIAVWNGSQWSALGSGIGGAEEDTVYALAIFNGNLYAGGSFGSAGGASADNIAMWNGTGWSALGSGTNGEVHSLLVFNSVLVAGGNFSNTGNDIAAWNGSTWQSYGQGFNTSGGSNVFALAVFNGQLTAAGRFQQSGATSVNNIAYWNNTSWQPLGAGIGSASDRVFALAVFNSTLAAGGKFSTAGGNSANNIARWTGSVWQNVGAPNDIDNDVDALVSYNNELIAGGNFKFTGGLYSSRITKWNGASWSRMITGTNDKVNALFVKDTSLFAAGEFNFAGGYSANSVARWYNQATGTISGLVLYSDNNQPVPSGKVRAFRIDKFTRELISEDSSLILNGAYAIHGGLHNDTLRVIAFPDDALDFVPTFFPSSIDWSNSITVIPGANSSYINIIVGRVTPGPLAPLSATIGGHIYLNISIPGNPAGNYPYQSDAILYVKSGGTFKRFAISRTDESYTTSQLDPGTYDLYVYRAGYMSAVRTIALGTTNIDTINFHLDTLDIIGLHNISRNVPKEFVLGQNYPNPFNPATSILFSLPKGGHAELVVYNILGQKVAELVNEELKQGEYRYNFDASALPSGIYFYRLRVNDFVDAKKMTLIK